MSFEEFIKGASDVCYRPFNEFYASRKAHAEEDVEEDGPAEKSYSRIQTFSGKVRDETFKSKSTSYFDEFLNSLPKEFADLCQVLRNVKRGIQESQTFDNNQLYQHSRHIYDFLFMEFGSEYRIKATRTFFKVLDDSTKITPMYTNISSGSKGEGLNVPGGDYDLMTILEQIKVKHDNSTIEEDRPILLFDNQHSYPGFAHLKIGQNQFSKELFASWGENTFYGPLISNNRFKNYFLSLYRDNDCMLHGPCISDSKGFVDHLFCFRAMLWPDVAESWLIRKRSSTWPPTDVMLKSVSQGILLVPIGIKFGSTEDCSFEWRISFSLQERDLIHSFNYVQVLCYKVFKYLKKDLISESGLCSYFIKTAIFWLSEELGNNFWIPENFLQCLHEIQRRLTYWFVYGYCPHYFIVENNLFEGLLPEERELVEVALHNLFPLLLRSIFYQKPKLHFTAFNDYKVINTPFIERSKSIFILLKVARSTLSWCTVNQSRSIVHKALFRLLHNKPSYFTKDLYMLFFCYANQVLPQDQRNSFHKENKRMYSSYKQCMAHFLIGTKVDAMNGWLLLASYFYRMDKPLNTLKITEILLAKPREDKMLIDDGYHEDVMMTYLEQVAATKWNQKFSFMTCMKIYCVDMLYIIPWSTLNLEELLPDVYFKVCKIPPVIYAHFLRFVCYNADGNISLREREISEIIKTCHNNCFLGDWKGRATAYAILANIYKSINKDQSADYWKSHFLRFYREHPKF
ncbi:Hypothetical predicted protein [Mytilus galloprovincialis]|uniref:Mab-21-like HhH/H2TH-like domain-containing protein n=1 Tax=Mytilus galloprovincialis TaxID=29158 RepID=A0A8B6CYZ4_MYTGA|nr:Hypothetical predicted protein [Mytilus galloprovincialis]